MFPGYGQVWFDQGGTHNILSLSDTSLRKETQVIYAPHNGFVVTTTGGDWRIRRGNFGWQFLEAQNFQHFDIIHNRFDYHNANRMLREMMSGYDLAP